MAAPVVARTGWCTAPAAPVHVRCISLCDMQDSAAQGRRSRTSGQPEALTEVKVTLGNPPAEDRPLRVGMCRDGGLEPGCRPSGSSAATPPGRLSGIRQDCRRVSVANSTSAGPTGRRGRRRLQPAAACAIGLAFYRFAARSPPGHLNRPLGCRARDPRPAMAHPAPPGRDGGESGGLAGHSQAAGSSAAARSRTAGRGPATRRRSPAAG